MKLVTQHLFWAAKKWQLSNGALAFLEHKADTKRAEIKLETRHFWAVFNDNYDIVLNLLRSGADVDLTNKSNTAIRFVVKKRER